MSLNYTDFGQIDGELPYGVQSILQEIAEKIGKTIKLSNVSGNCEGFGLEAIDGEEIGEIYIGKYNAGYNTYTHIGIEINTGYRRLGIGSNLYAIWQEFGNELLEEEYSRQYAKIKFLIELGYVPVSLINDDSGREVEINGDISDERIGNGYSCKLVIE